MEESASAASLNYGQLCRICLRSGADFLIINAPIDLDEGCESDDKLSFLDCLQYCTRLNDPPEFPAHICLQCSTALQVAYKFIQTAIRAHETLRMRLNNSADGRSAVPLWNNESEPDENCNTDSSRTSSKMRFRCKLCNEKLESKKALKEHVTLHLDIISYCCQLCSFECKKRSKLGEHYIKVHDTEATRDQLRPKTENIKEELDVEQDDEIYLEMEQIHNAPNSLGIEQQLEQSENAIKAFDLNSSLQRTDNIAAGLTNDIKVISDLQYSEEFNSIPPNELRVGNEFIVMSDGTVEEVMGNGVIIEYINAADDGVTLESGLVLNNVVQVEPTDVLQTIVNSIDMDVEDMIIEEVSGSELMSSITTSSQETTVQTLENIEDALPPSIITNSKIKCKLCVTKFQTPEQLKIHMLSHNEIPHFFCDQCAFYTFFKIDLTQHYHTEHKLQPTLMQLQPKNRVKPVQPPGVVKYLYSCDMCLFETNLKAHLRRHYLSQHQEEATEVQLRPTVVDDISVYSQSLMTEAPPLRSPQKKQLQTLRPDYPKGLNCKKCSKTFFWRNKLKDHYKQHSIEEGRVIEGMRSVSTSANASKHKYALNNKSANNYSTHVTITSTGSSSAPTPAPDIMVDRPSPAVCSLPAANATSVEQQQQQYTTNTNISLGYACMQIPSDAIPQIVETETTIDHDLQFVLNDELFEDFDDDVNDDENDNGDTTEFQDLQMTSEDDLDEMLEETNQRRASDADGKGAENVYQPYCVHCNKKFYSQYLFENHMFVHRGVAPYRCEMCTNLYNTKRALIRHYKAVHKKMPTRDMIQAKGDKAVSGDRLQIEHLDVAEQKAVTLMCAKCPYESTELTNLHIHLNTVHGITDENYILQKMPFECPRCIRSFATKARLLRHLQRSHSVATIIRVQQQNNGTTEVRDSAETNSFENSRCGLRIGIDNLLTCTIPSTPTSTKSYDSADTAITATGSIRATLHSCNICYLSWPVASALHAHQAQVHNQRLAVAMPPVRLLYNFKCDICGGKYKSRNLLKHHKKRHTERKFPCSHCPKMYINRRELENHQRLHTGELPHKCNVCGKKFRYAHHMKRHQEVTHLGKRFQCPEDGCERVFTTKGQLKIHALNHSGHMPYHCKYCGRLFKKREALRQHTRKLHNCNLTETELADNYRQNVGYTNPHDLTVSGTNGAMMRRCDVEAEAARGARELQICEEQEHKHWQISRDIEVDGQREDIDMDI